MTSGTRRRLRQLAWITLVVCAITPFFNMLTDEASLRSAIQGAIDGALITILVGGYLLLLRDGRFRPWFRRLGFATDLVVSSAIALALFLVGRATGLMLTSLSPRRFLTSFFDAQLVYGLPYFAILVVVIQFVLQMNRIIGTNVLRYFIAGVYHRPRAEERIFLFIDLAGSTQLAERLGSARYFELLRQFVDDLSEPVLESRGAIYQYAGDEVVITWPIEAGTRAAACVRCFSGSAPRSPRARLGTRPSSAWSLASAAASTAAPSPGASWVTSGRRSCSWATSSTPPPASRSTRSARGSSSSSPAPSWIASSCLPGIEAVHCGELELRGKDAPVTAYSLRAAPVLE